MSWPLRRLVLRGAGVALFGLGLALASTATTGAQAGEPRFTLNASGASVTCDEPSAPSECNVGVGAAFTLSIELLDPPAAGYIAIQTQIYLDGLSWTPATTSQESVWPDNSLPVRSPDPPGPGAVSVSYGGLTSTSSPFPLSHYEGAVVEMQVSCSQAPQTFDPTLIAYDQNAGPLGSSVTLEDTTTTISSPVIGTAELDLVAAGEPQTYPVTNILAIKCGGQSAPEGDGVPGFEEGATIDGGTQPGDTPDATGAPNGQTPGQDGTAGPGEGTPATAEPRPGGEDEDDDGGAPWVIIAVVIGAVVVAGAGGAYLWYLRRSRAAGGPPAAS